MYDKKIKSLILLTAAVVNIFIGCFVSFADTGSSMVTSANEASVVTSQAANSSAAGIQVPELNSATGIVINADTGEVLWGKDENTRYYPASITKVMTALLVMENCSLDDMVTFSKSATTNLESGATTARMSEGDRMSVRDCLYALMLKSANEVANALAEHIAGSVPKFADMMNKRAKELGCTNTNFVNPNGLNNEKHLTTAHDMALIAAAAFKYEELRKIDTTNIYRLPASQKDKSGLLISLNNKILMKNHEKYYEYAIAGKTGYTTKAGNTLVTVAEKDGVRLAAVTMKNQSYLAHYDDTKALFEYGFAVMEARKAAEGAGQTGGNDTGTASQTQTDANAASAANRAVLIGPGIKAD
ncbi:MAG: D-alanyl-D-alanine carboxypeptidase family protein [Lachnospiraceae bacterium]|nr:D-alanyl-D-alanine carboxypeptidase family protein [Lachnospiraceae bacterium]